MDEISDMLASTQLLLVETTAKNDGRLVLGRGERGATSIAGNLLDSPTEMNISDLNVL